MKTAAKILFFITGAVATALMAHSCWTFERDDPPCPKINSFAPKGGAFGEEITITGEGFFAGLPNLHIIKIGNTIVPEDSVRVVDAETIKFQVPKGAENGNISVTLRTAQNCVAVSAERFVYYYTATVSTFAGQVAGSLKGPTGLDIDLKGIIWVADQSANVVRKIGPDGNVIGTIGGSTIGCTNNSVSPGNPVSFNQPTDVVTDPSGNVFVADKANSVIKKITVQEGIDRIAGRCGFSDDSLGHCLNKALFLGPLGLCHDASKIYVLDGGQVKKIDENCNVSRLVNSGGMISFANSMVFSRARAGAGPLIVAESAGKKGLFSINDNTGQVSAIPLSMPNPLSQPIALQVDPKGNIFIADKEMNQIFVAYTNGQIVPLAGTGEMGATNGNGSIAKFNAPSGLLLTLNSDQSILLYVSDFGNHTIRRVTLE